MSFTLPDRGRIGLEERLETSRCHFPLARVWVPYRQFRGRGMLHWFFNNISKTTVQMSAKARGDGLERPSRH